MEREALAIDLEREQYNAEMAQIRKEGREEGRTEVIRALVTNHNKTGVSESAICYLLKVSLNLTNDELLRYLK